MDASPCSATPILMAQAVVAMPRLFVKTNQRYGPAPTMTMTTVALW